MVANTVRPLGPHATEEQMLTALTLEACQPLVQCATLDANAILFFKGDLDPTLRFDTVPPGTAARCPGSSLEETDVDGAHRCRHPGTCT